MSMKKAPNSAIHETLTWWNGSVKNRISTAAKMMPSLRSSALSAGAGGGGGGLGTQGRPQRAHELTDPQGPRGRIYATYAPIEPTSFVC
jgi:hypothetical protein